MNGHSYARTHVGRRANNEDAHFASDALGLYIVADGMGGYEGGEVASQLTTTTMHEFFERRRMDEDETWPFGYDEQLGALGNMLGSAIRLANSRVLARKAGKLERMGSTVACIALEGPELVIGHVGDSRVYRLRAGKLERLTRDHSLCAEMEAAGMLEPGGSDAGIRNVITRALGMPDVSAELRRELGRPGDLYLLCSDGLLETVADAEIEQVLLEQPLEKACEMLVESAYAAGGRDNITVVVVELLE